MFILKKIKEYLLTQGNSCSRSFQNNDSSAVYNNNNIYYKKVVLDAFITIS